MHYLNFIFEYFIFLYLLRKKYGKKNVKNYFKKFSLKKKDHIRLIQTVKNQVRVREIRTYFSQIKFSHLLYLTHT